MHAPGMEGVLHTITTRMAGTPGVPVLRVRRHVACAQVRWVDPGPEREEQLVSVSTDGRVKAWTLSKGLLEHVTLITLKRVPHRLGSAAGGHRSGGGSGSGLAALSAAATATAGGGAAKPAAAALLAGSGAKAPAAVASKRDAQISLHTGGMSFDFSAVDRRMYLAGARGGCTQECACWRAGAMLACDCVRVQAERVLCCAIPPQAPRTGTSTSAARATASSTWRHTAATSAPCTRCSGAPLRRGCSCPAAATGRSGCGRRAGRSS